MTERISQGQPPYLQIADELRRKIVSSELAPGDHLPSDREIARQSGCTYATAAKVLATLRREGLAESLPGHATVVSARKRHRHLGERDPVVLFEGEQDGALDADLLGVGGGQLVEACARRRHRTS